MLTSEENHKPDVLLDVMPAVVGAAVEGTKVEVLVAADTTEPCIGDVATRTDPPCESMASTTMTLHETTDLVDVNAPTQHFFIGSTCSELVSGVDHVPIDTVQTKLATAKKGALTLPDEPKSKELPESPRTSSLRRMPAAPESDALSHGLSNQTSNGFSSEGKSDKVIELQQELKRAYKDLEQVRTERDALQLQVSGMQQPRYFAVAACDFLPNRLDVTESGIVVPKNGSMLQVSKNDSLEILGRHVTGWVHVKHTVATACQMEEGWIPDGVLRAVGEVGRGVASRDCGPAEEDLDSQELGVAQGTLLKLLNREGEWWWVEADGCRGCVPVDAVREPTPEEESGMNFLGAKLRMARSRLPTGDAEDLPWAAAPSERGEADRGKGRENKDEKRRLVDGKDEQPRQAVDAKDVGEKKPDKPAPWTFGLWAYLASYYAQGQCVLLGLAGILWYTRDDRYYPPAMQMFSDNWRHLFSSAWAVAWGIGWFLFNTRSNLASSSGTLPPGTPFRALIFLLMSIPQLMSGVTVLSGMATAVVAGLSFTSATRHEVGCRPNIGRRSPAKWLKDDLNEELKGIACCSFRYWRTWWAVQVYRGERPKIFILIIWFLANIGLCAHKYFVTRRDLRDPDSETVKTISERCWTGGEEWVLMDTGDSGDDCLVLLDAYRLWIPWAKLFGQGLNLNCALIAFPVCQHFMRKINTWAITKQGIVGYICRNLPTHKNLVFHKGLAATIAVMAYAHTFAHYMAYSFTLTTFKRYGVSGTTVTLSVWITGAAPLMCILVMFPVSREYVKHTNFEAFIYTHVVCAGVFMACLLWHGPIFYLFASVPLCLYLIDRYFRSEVKSLTTAKLLKMNWRPPVMQLVFDTPFKYHSGQYVWLCCPHLGKYERHPFTIASAPETELLSLAIKCWPGGWTERLRMFLAALCESSAGSTQGFSHTFEEVDWISGETIRGIAKLADGSPVLQIDGPHAAPAMRYCEFKVIILAAAGIGLTPASSILKSLLQYRWRQFPNVSPHSIHFAWLVPCAEVPAYDWFSDELASSEVAAAANKAIHGDATDPGRNCEIHIFVTRAPAVDKSGARGPPAPKKAELHGPIAKDLDHVIQPYTPTELIEWLQHPSTKSDSMLDVLAKPSGERPNEAGHTLVWNGRPNWDNFFTHVEQMHSGQGTEVGVFFCGAPLIGKDLKRECYRHSSSDVRFRLLKENF